MNSFFSFENNNYGNKFTTGYESNNNDERDSGIESYYGKKRYDQDNNIFKNIYKNNDLKLSTQNILNRSSSDIYSKIKRKDDNSQRYNYLLNINNINNNNDNEERRETETNERNSDYYVQSYKNNLLRTNYRTKDYNHDNNNNNINNQTNINFRINKSTNFNDVNQSKNYLDYFNNKANSLNNINNNENNYLNKRMNEEKYERFNYLKQNNYNNMNNDKNDFFDDVNQFKKQINSRFNNFREFIRGKRKEIVQEENKSRNFEEQEKFGKEIEGYGNKNYLRKYQIRNFNNNYQERTSLQNLIDEYKSKFSALENSINKMKNKSRLNKTFSMDKKFFNK